MFWLGLLFDGLGTYFVGAETEGFEITFHTVMGAFGLFLMLFHTIWATFILWKNQQSYIYTFHRFSLIVWVIWLIPYITGLILGAVVV
jgi:uncharacterized repeat protein (TIGR03987 family)